MRKKDSISEALRSYEHDSEVLGGIYGHEASGWASMGAVTSNFPKNAIKCEREVTIDNLELHESRERIDDAQQRHISGVL